MKRYIVLALAAAGLCLWSGGDADGRGFGGGGGSFHAAGGSFGGGGGEFHGGGGEYHGGEFGSYSGSHSYGGYSDWRGGGAVGGYDHSWTGDRGGSVNVDGTRGAAYGPNGAVAGGSRDVSVTTPGGRTFNDDKAGGVAVGPYGRVVGGAGGTKSVVGPNGAAGESWHSAYAGTHFATDAGLSHYSAVGVAGTAHSTAYWSAGAVTARGGYVRTNFGYYTCFHPGWYTAHPGCWFAAGWAAGYAWRPWTWGAFYPYCGFGAEPYDYDYGNTIVYQDNNVYVGGQDAGTPVQYAQQATAIADAGAAVNPSKDEDWQPLGVFALVQGDDKTSNNVFQLAVNKDGIIRGNYYDGVMDSTTDVYGSVDKKTQRAAWTIGKKKDRVFEAGAWNLTQAEAPCLVHLGTDKTQQWLLVRLDAPKDGK
jgi:hypothetical protein